MTSSCIPLHYNEILLKKETDNMVLPILLSHFLPGPFVKEEIINRLITWRNFWTRYLKEYSVLRLTERW